MLRGSEEIRRLDPACLDAAGLTTAMAVRAADRNKPWNIHVDYGSRPLHFRHASHKHVPEASDIQCRYFFTATSAYMRTARHTDPLCPHYSFGKSSSGESVPMICQMRGGPDELFPADKAARVSPSLTTTDIPGASPAAPRPLRPPKTAPSATREHAHDPAAASAPPAPITGGFKRLSGSVPVRVPLDVCDIVVPRRRFATRVPCSLTTAGIDHGTPLYRTPSREVLREYALRNALIAQDRPVTEEHALGSCTTRGHGSHHEHPRDKSRTAGSVGMHGHSRGLSRFAAGRSGTDLSNLSHGLPEFRPKTTSSFPLQPGELAAGGAGSKRLRANGFGRFPATAAHKHVFTMGRNVRVHDMPPRIRGDC
eukprot:jgi/Ulvmu1/9416/UM051_0044.1